MTMDEWISLYECRAEKFYIPPDFKTFFKPEKGFFLWRVRSHEPVFEISHACTHDIAYLRIIANSMAKKFHCVLMRTRTYKNPAAYIRLTGAYLNLERSEVRPNGLFYWCMEKEVK
jgi:hypothetical protein